MRLHPGLAPELRAKFSEWMGRPPHETAAGRDIFHIRNPKRPEYRFEWHPRKRIVYLVRLGARPEIGEAMALDIVTHGDAINAVAIWARGYDEGRAPLTPKSHLQL